MLKRYANPLIFAALASVFAPTAFAQEFNAFNAQILRASGYKLGRYRATTLTGEWANAWRYGDNFAFVDVASPFGEEWVAYGEWSPRLSLSKLSGREISAGPLRDVLLAGNVQQAGSVTVWLGGVGVDLDIAGFDFFKVNVYRKDIPGFSGTSRQLEMSWRRTFVTGPVHWEFGGFLDWASAEGDRNSGAYSHPNLLSQPQLMFDLGRLLGGAPNRILAGVEWQIWRNKFGVDGFDESVLQAALKLNL